MIIDDVEIDIFDIIPSNIPMAPLLPVKPSSYSRGYSWAMAVTSANNCAKVTGSGRHILKQMCPLFTGERWEPTWCKVNYDLNELMIPW